MVLFLRLFVSPRVTSLFLVVIRLFSSRGVFSTLFFFFHSVPTEYARTFFCFSWAMDGELVVISMSKKLSYGVR